MFKKASDAMSSLTEEFKNLEDPNPKKIPNSQIKVKKSESKVIQHKNSSKEEKKSTLIKKGSISKPRDSIKSNNKVTVSSFSSIPHLSQLLKITPIPFVDSSKLNEAKEIFNIKESPDPDYIIPLISCYNQSLKLTPNLTLVIFERIHEIKEEIQKNMEKATSNKKFSFEEKFEDWLDDANPQEISKITKSLIFNLSCKDFHQGQLGDCYLVSTMKILQYHHLAHIFPIPDISTSGFYTLNLFRDGKFTPVLISDLIPGEGRGIKFNGETFAFALIEKAYAKMYGGYQAMNVGFPIDALRDLTGLPASYIDLKDVKDALSKIQKAIQIGKPLLASSKKILPSNSIIHKFHSYAIIDCQTKNGKTYLKLQDPNRRSYPSRTLNGFNGESEIGEVWLTESEISENLEVVTVGFQPHKFIRCELPITREMCVIRAVVFEKGNYTFSLYQTFKKESKEYCLQRILVGNSKRVDCEFGLKRTADIGMTCDPGVYLICTLTEGSSTLVSNGPGPCYFERTTINYDDAVKSLLQIHSESVGGSVLTDIFGGEVQARTGKVGGLSYFAYKSNCQESTYFESLILLNCQNIFFNGKPFNNKDTTFEIVLSPQESSVIYFSNGKEDSGSFALKSSRINCFEVSGLTEERVKQLCKSMGKSKKRYEDVNFTQLDLGNPLVFYFSNTGLGKYEETMTFSLENRKIQIMKNCSIENNNKVKIELEAGQDGYFYLLKFDTFDESSLSFKSTFKYIK